MSLALAMENFPHPGSENPPPAAAAAMAVSPTRVIKSTSSPLIASSFLNCATAPSSSRSSSTSYHMKLKQLALITSGMVLLLPLLFLQQLSSTLRSINLLRSRDFTSIGLLRLATNCSSLVEIDLSNGTELTDSAALMSATSMGGTSGLDGPQHIMHLEHGNRVSKQLRTTRTIAIRFLCDDTMPLLASVVPDE